MEAYLFPGQGSQFLGMGKDLYNKSKGARQLFDYANNFLNRDITAIMFEGSPEALQQTEVTQLAIFLHSVIAVKVLPKFQPDMVAGHSSGEIAALVANQVISFEDGMRLVTKRADVMQHACNTTTGTMAAIIGLPDKTIEKVCRQIAATVVPANYNCPGQLVISGSKEGVLQAYQALQEAGAKKIVPLKVSGGFHSPLMETAGVKFSKVVDTIVFHQGICPIYQNVSTCPVIDPLTIKDNLIQQLVAPIQWTATIQNMIKDGASSFIECGPGSVLQGLVRKINRSVTTKNLSVAFNHS